MAKTPRFQLLSARTVTLLFVATIAVIFVLDFILGYKSALVEMERSVGIISICLFLFLSHLLYRGVRLKNEPIIEGKWSPIKGTRYSIETLSALSNFAPPLELFGDGIGGIITSILIWIFATIIVLCLLFFMANLIWGILFVLAVAIYWLFYRALRVASVKSRKSKGKIWPSIGYALLFTVLYTGWIYGALLGFKILFR